MSDDHSVGFLHRRDDRIPVVWLQTAQIDNLNTDALLLGLLRSHHRTLHERAVGDDRKIRSFAHCLRFAEGNHEIVRRILRFVVGLAVEMFVFEKQHRIVAANRRAQQTIRIERSSTDRQLASPESA